MSATDRSQMTFGFALINMKKTIAPYANKTNPLMVGGARGSTAAHLTANGTFPAPLQATRNDLLRQFEAFSETINKVSTAKELTPAFGAASELGKRNTMFDNMEKSFTAYSNQLEIYASYAWNPPPEQQYATGVDVSVDALMASCVPMDAVITTSNVDKTVKAASIGVKGNPTSAANLCAYYFFWTNCLGDGRGGTVGPNHAIADWRYDIASMHFNMAVVYMSSAAYLAFLCSAFSFPNYYPAADTSIARQFANTNATSLMEKECYAHCCNAAYHFEKCIELMKIVMGGEEVLAAKAAAKKASANSSVTEGIHQSVPSSSASSSQGGDKPAFKSEGHGSTAAGAGSGADSGEMIVAGGVESSHVPIDMTISFLSLLKEVMIAQGQEMAVAKAFKAGREDNGVSKMTFTSITGRLLLGAKTLFSNAEALTKNDLVIMKAGFASFVAAIQTKAAAYEALAYAVQGAYMAVPITSSQRIEMAIMERERIAKGGAPGGAGAAAIGEDAGANPEDGLWCINKARELGTPLPERAAKTGCAPAVRTWLNFMIQRFIGEVETNMAELQRMGLTRKASNGPVALKSAMIVAKPKPFAPVAEK